LNRVVRKQLAAALRPGQPLANNFRLLNNSVRAFSDAPAVQGEEAESEVQQELPLNQRVGADDVFSENKHAYVLTFPWNYPEVIARAQTAYPSPSGFWKSWDDRTKSSVCFNSLYRDFHQACALPDAPLLKRCCESNLAAAVNASVNRIHFHGLDIEMANLCVENKITVINVEIFHGLDRDRSVNGPAD